MPRLTKIYTRKGDEGKTSLGGGQRVPKHHLRVQAYGTLDELNSQIGVAVAHGVSPKIAGYLATIQNELFHVGSDMCFLEDDKEKYQIPQIEERHVQALENIIDELNAVVGPLKNFILPGGSLSASHLHVARTICRRAEREASQLVAQEPIGGHVQSYLNRLSDALFVMARYENHDKNVEEPLWNSRL